MRNSWMLLLVSICMFSCVKPTPRRPVRHNTTSFYKELIKQSKLINAKEHRCLAQRIQKDTLHKYISSEYGFWYYYNQKNDRANVLSPKSEDLVSITYTVKDVFGKTIYDKQQKIYKIDKEDFIPALDDGIKLMKPGEIITFVVPSYRAYGVVGDGNRIKINQALKIKVKLNNVKIKSDEIK